MAAKINAMAAATHAGEVKAMRERDGARAGDEMAEDAMAARIVRESRAARGEGRETLLPDWLSAAILAGDHPVKAARQRIGMTQAGLAAASGLAQGTISDAESGRRALSHKAIAKIAQSMGVDPAWLD